MVFSSHQSLLPVTSMVKSAVMLWDQFWFGVFCVWVFTATAASPRQSLEGKSVWTNQGDCRRDGYVYKSVCACAQLCTCSPAEELWRHYITTFHACSLCVLGQFWERRGGCGVREGWGGGTGAVHFSPFKLNVTQTTPLAHAHTQAHTHFFLAENLTEENLQHLPKCVRVSKKKTQRNGKRSRNAQNAQKKYTIVPIWCCISEGEREPCLAAWGTPFELDCVCACVCVSAGLPGRHTKPLYIHVAAKCSLENNPALTHTFTHSNTHTHTLRALEASRSTWCACLLMCVCCSENRKCTGAVKTARANGLYPDTSTERKRNPQNLQRCMNEWMDAASKIDSLKTTQSQLHWNWMVSTVLSRLSGGQHHQESGSCRTALQDKTQCE